MAPDRGTAWNASRVYSIMAGEIPGKTPIQKAFVITKSVLVNGAATRYVASL
jgi:hypothetical protein